MCVIALQALSGDFAEVRGNVVRCRYVGDNVHEVAITFGKPIGNLGNFLVAYREGNEASNPDRELHEFSGKALYVEDSPDDRDLVGFLLGKHGVDVRALADPLEALRLIDAESFDLVITDHNLPVMTGAQVAEALRGKGFAGAIIAVTAEEGQDIKRDILAKGCTDVLIKPYDFDDLLSLVKAHLSDGKGAEAEPPPLFSDKWSDLSMRPLIHSYLDRLDKRIGEVMGLLGAEDRVGLQRLCQELKGSAKGYGYRQISDAAAEVQHLASAGAPIDRLRAAATALTQLCAAACQVRKTSDA